MDLSSTTRALQSLQRRQPPLSDPVVAVSQQLLDLENNNNKDEQLLFVTLITELVDNDRWEALAVGVFVATQALEESSLSSSVYMEGPRVPSMIVSTATATATPKLSPQQSLQLCHLLHTIALQHMEHSEPRVRSLVAKAVGAYIKVSLQLNEDDDENDTTTGKKIRTEIVSQVLTSIQTHIETGRDTAAKAAADAADSTTTTTTTSSSSYSKSSTGALDDTTGWRALETNWQCLAALINGLGSYYLLEFGLSSDYHLLQNMEHSAIHHVNRHVRAAAMNVLEQLITAAASSDTTQHYLTEVESPLCQTTVQVLKAGLADNWSQVRMAASVLCRVFLTALQQLAVDLTPYWPTLLPRMCLNRFYLAQGVKLYSHETWKLVLQSSGLDTVTQNLPSMVHYYTQMCDADNHAVREAACQAIAELATRIAATYPTHLLPHIAVLLQALIMCFHDESWPVRDEACVACGWICKAYPEQCRPHLTTLWTRWTEQLTDPIWSVRQDAAVALGYALEAYGLEFLIQLRALIAQLLPSAKEQPAMTPEEFKAHQNNVEAHTDSQLYSCGSLAPKLRKSGAGRIGCSSCDVDRPKAPWEATDGCIYLIREVVLHCAPPDSPTPMSDDELIPLLRELADVCRVQHFPQGNDLRTTLWRQLPIMAHALGKDRFKKRYLEPFVDLLFSNLEARTASQLSIHAAGQCAEELAHFIGIPMFRGRLEDYQKDIFDHVMRERQLMPKGPSEDAGAFSPFGPPGLLDSSMAGGGGGSTTTALSGGV